MARSAHRLAVRRPAHAARPPWPRASARSGSLYVNCDLPTVEDMVRDPQVFFRGCSKPVVVFDEIHQLRDPARVLKIGADGFPQLKILATGSSTLAASKKFRDTLTGRKRVVHLTPVLWDELPAFGVAAAAAAVSWRPAARVAGGVEAAGLLPRVDGLLFCPRHPAAVRFPGHEPLQRAVRIPAAAERRAVRGHQDRHGARHHPTHGGEPRAARWKSPTPSPWCGPSTAAARTSSSSSPRSMPSTRAS